MAAPTVRCTFPKWIAEDFLFFLPLLRSFYDLSGRYVFTYVNARARAYQCSSPTAGFIEMKPFANENWWDSFHCFVTLYYLISYGLSTIKYWKHSTFFTFSVLTFTFTNRFWQNLAHRYSPWKHISGMNFKTFRIRISEKIEIFEISKIWKSTGGEVTPL